MPVKPKDSRLVGFNRVKPRLQRLPKRPAIPDGLTLAQDATGLKFSYNPPASSPNPRITPTPFLPPHLRQFSTPSITAHLPPPLDRHRETSRLTESQIEEVKALRESGLGVKALAEKFNVSTIFISLVAPLPKEKRAALQSARDAQKATWSEKKQIYAQIRQQRRAAWGS